MEMCMTEREVGHMLLSCWACVVDVGSTSNQHLSTYCACWSTAGFHTASVLILYMKNINIFKYKYCLKNKIFDRNEVQEL